MTHRRIFWFFGLATPTITAVLAACHAAPPRAPLAAPVGALAVLHGGAAPAPASTFAWSHLARLHDARGAVHDAEQLAGAKAAVVVFAGAECPLTAAYLPKLDDLHDAYAKRGIAFFAVYSNEQDTEAKVAAHAAKYELRFPASKDAHNALADELGATTTPEAFVVSPENEILYRGQIDDQYGIGVHKFRATEWYVAGALDAVLAGRAVPVARTEPQGCSVSRERRPAPSGAVTYTRDVAPILQRRCQGCHSPGQIGPMPLLTYEDAFAWSATIRSQVASRRMPPWGAEGPSGVFANDAHLGDDEYRTVLQWIDEGGPRGSDADLPPQTPVITHAAAPPDVVASMAEPFDVPSSGVIDYQYAWSDQTFDHDLWVRAARTTPGAPDVVHHVVALVVYPQDLTPAMTAKPPEWETPGHIVSIYASPMTDMSLPAGYAKKIPKGSRMYFQLHYTANGFARHDKTSVGLYAERAPKRQVIEAFALNTDIDIPAFDPSHEEAADLTLPVSGEIMGLMPHTHLRGKDFRYELVRPGAAPETILWVPKFDFFLNEFYRFAGPLRFEKGSVVKCTAHYDNSAGNPNNPDPSRETKWGDQTWDEMMIGFFDVSLDLPVDSKEMRKYDLSYAGWVDTATRTAVYR